MAFRTNYRFERIERERVKKAKKEEKAKKRQERGEGERVSDAPDQPVEQTPGDQRQPRDSETISRAVEKPTP